MKTADEPEPRFGSCRGAAQRISMLQYVVIEVCNLNA